MAQVAQVAQVAEALELPEVPEPPQVDHAVRGFYRPISPSYKCLPSGAVSVKIGTTNNADEVETM